MRFLPLATTLATLFVVSQLRAQQPDNVRVAAIDKPGTTVRLVSPGEVVATPEMWLYEQQLRRIDDPALAFRAISAQKAAERRARLAAMRWYGMSNSRPKASIDVVHGPYSPQWSSGGYQPYLWNGGPASTATIYVPVAR